MKFHLSSLMSSDSDIKIVDSGNEGDDYSEEEDVYEVEKIVNHRRRGNKTQYFIKWKGYPSSENTWEDEDNLNCDELLQEYLEKVRKNEELTRIKSKPIPQPKKIIDIFKRDGVIYYKALYRDGNTGEIDSVSLRKLRPLVAIDFLESRANFKIVESI